MGREASAPALDLGALLSASCSDGPDRRPRDQDEGLFSWPVSPDIGRQKRLTLSRLSVPLSLDPSFLSVSHV